MINVYCTTTRPRPYVIPMPAELSAAEYFSYLTAAISLVLGLGIVTCLNGIAEILKVRDGERLYWVQIVWVVQTLLTQLQAFWTMLQNREIMMTLTFFEYVGFWLYPLALYLLSALLFPSDDHGEPMDLRHHYYLNHRWIFAVATVPPVLFLIFHLVYLELPLLSIQNTFPVAFAGITVTLSITERPRVHATMAIVLPVLFITVIVLYRLHAAATTGAMAP